MIRAALDFDVAAVPQPTVDDLPGDTVVHVDVSMTNRAGHPIPDGCPTTTKLVLDVVARTPDGNEFYFDEKSFMPVPQSYGRGDKMGRGPFQKAGMILDTALPPLREVRQHYEIPVPLRAGREIEISVRLLYLPYGSTREADDPVVWRDVVRKVTLDRREGE
jgi:hypothetical protein